MYEFFIADCKREMRLKHMTNKDLANATGYKVASIDSFFADIKGREKSKKVAQAISIALNITQRSEKSNE